jgi:hypothetical protein
MADYVYPGSFAVSTNLASESRPVPLVAEPVPTRTLSAKQQRGNKPEF